MKTKSKPTSAREIVSYAASALKIYLALSAAFRKSGTPKQEWGVLKKIKRIHVEDTDLAEKALEMVEDRSLNKSWRTGALSKIGDFLFNSEEAIMRLIRILRHTDEDSGVRYAVLQTLISLSFASPAIIACNDQWMNALRELTDDPNRQLKAAALEYLANRNDEEGLEKVKADLMSSDHVLPVSKSVQLLGLNRSGDYNDIIREQLEKTTEPDVQLEAIHALSSDPKSEGLIVNKLNDKSGMKDVRLASLKALQILNPGAYASEARKLVDDDSDYHDVRIAAISSFVHLPQFANLLRDQNIADKVKNLAKEKPFASVSANYLSSRNVQLNE